MSLLYSNDFLYMLQGNLGQEWFLWLCRRRQLVQVVNNSMLPLLKPGERVFVNPYAYQNALPQVDDIVIAWHPNQKGLKIIKRIGERLTDGRYILRSENPMEGKDSLSFGPVPESLILGRVTCLAVPRS